MANYKRGPWDEHSPGCGVAHEELGAVDLLDHEMDRYQEAGYRYVRSIHRDPGNPDVKAWAETALNHFAAAERLEMLIESLKEWMGCNQGNGTKWRKGPLLLTCRGLLQAFRLGQTCEEG